METVRLFCIVFLMMNAINVDTLANDVRPYWQRAAVRAVASLLMMGAVYLTRHWV